MYPASRPMCWNAPPSPWKSSTVVSWGQNLKTSEVLFLLWPKAFPVSWTLPVGEAASPGMFSSPDTRTFSGRRCIMETNAGCFFTTQSKCVPSIFFKRLRSGKKRHMAYNMCLSNISFAFWTQIGWIWYPTTPSIPTQSKNCHPSPWSHISAEALSHLTTWCLTCKHFHLSIFHLPVFDLGAMFHYTAKVIFQGLNRNAKHSAWKTCSTGGALYHIRVRRHVQWGRHFHLSSRSSSDKWQPTIPTINTKHRPFGGWAIWCLMRCIGWLPSSLNSIAIFQSDRVNDSIL